jgi:hypothetical protein
MDAALTALRPRRGRPRNYSAPSRAVTITLPEAVLAWLESIDPDVSRAIVRLAMLKAEGVTHPPAELAVFGRRAVIVVKPTPALQKRIGVDLVPLPDGRALISFNHPKTVAELELLLQDALDDPRLSADDRVVFEAIGSILKGARRSKGVTLLHRNIIVLQLSASANWARGMRAGQDSTARSG